MYKITEQTFYKYLKCPHWIMYELRDGKDMREPLLRKLHDEGLLRERELELLHDRKDMEEVTLEDADEAFQQTLEMMSSGVQTIYRGALIHENWVARPDLLERVEGKSKLGDWYYVACDIKRSSHLKDEYKLQGAFYAEILERIQGIRPIQGYVLHTNGEIEGYLIDEVLSDFHITLKNIEHILEGEVPEPFLTSDCKQSPYFSECESQVRSCDDLSLLNRIWKSEADALRDAGISTVSTLALASKEQLNSVSGMAQERLIFLQKQAISIKENRVIKLHPIILPQESEIELIVDIESDPLRDLNYLIGVLKKENGEETYHAFFAENASGVKNMWNEFLEFLNKYTDAPIYHYGWYEVDVFRRLIDEHGASDLAKDRLIEKTTDLLVALRESVIFPLPFYSLKDIAKFLGFSWRSKDASGLDSVLWFHDYINEKSLEALKRIKEYNEDDVRATRFVIDWARK